MIDSIYSNNYSKKKTKKTKKIKNMETEFRGLTLPLFMRSYFYAQHKPTLESSRPVMIQRSASTTNQTRQTNHNLYDDTCIECQTLRDLCRELNQQGTRDDVLVYTETKHTTQPDTPDQKKTIMCQVKSSTSWIDKIWLFFIN